MSDTIAPLFAIMLDDEEFMRARLRAAEQILNFESPPDAVNATKAFLRKVYSNEKNSSANKLTALELIRKAEDKKTRPPQTADPNEGIADRMEAARLAWLRSLGPKAEGE